MVDYEYSYLFKQSSADKQLIIETDDKSVRITNNELHQQKFELEESLCSENQLKFGSCEASSIKFKVSNIFTSLKDKWINVSMVLDNHTDDPFQIGRYKVYSDIPSGDKSCRDLVAYDSLYDIINANMADWYNSLTFPLTLKEFRDSFFSYFGIEQKEIALINDYMSIEKTIETDELSGKDILSAICELNGCFGHIGRDGKFKYIILVQKAEGLFPNNTLYPEDGLFPAEKKSSTFSESKYKSCEYEDYTVQPIDKVQIRQEENDIGAISGNGTNCYVVQDNFLVYGKDSSELQSISDNLYYTIKSISYIPFNAVLSGNLCFEVGDAVQFNTKRQIVNSYILQRKMTGIQTLKDTFYAEGEYERFENVNSTNYQIVKLKGKTNTIERTVEETKSTITNVNDNLQSQITQTYESIETEVKRATQKETELSSRIEQTVSSISLKINNGEKTAGIVIKLENEDGTTSEVTGTIAMTGTVTFNDLANEGQTIIDGSNIKTGTIDGNNVNVKNLNASNIVAGILKAIAINNGNGTFSVDKNGNVTANSLKSSNAEITGGSLNIQSDVKTSKVELSGTSDTGDFKTNLSPSGLSTIQTGKNGYHSYRSLVDSGAVVVQDTTSGSTVTIMPTGENYNMTVSPVLLYANYCDATFKSVSQTSDARIKENKNIITENDLKLLDLLEPCSFNFIGDSNRQYGLYAQEVLEQIENLNIDTSIVSVGDDGYYRINYTQLIMLLLADRKNIISRIEALESKKY